MQECESFAARVLLGNQLNRRFHALRLTGALPYDLPTICRSEPVTLAYRATHPRRCNRLRRTLLPSLSDRARHTPICSLLSPTHSLDSTAPRIQRYLHTVEKHTLSEQITGGNTSDFSSDLSSHAISAPYLDHAQQRLLVAALNSQLPRSQGTGDKAQGTLALPVYNTSQHHSDGPQSQETTMDSLDNNFTPELLDFDDNFDFDNADLGGQMIGGYSEQDDDAPEQHEKRKNDDDDAELGDAKRQETTEKSAKKPGRKPLTNEPTTKRKAQNRAAQRAFRERKEAHLKDLETKVTELTKAQEADKHENGLLRAQVDRLQTELREYRKRMSLNNSTTKRSPSLTAQAPRQPMGFQFDFPKFGSLPAAQILGNGNGNSITPPLSNNSPISPNYGNQAQASRHNSETRSMSPATQLQFANTRQSSRMSSVDPTATGNFLPYSTSDNMHGFSGTLPQMGKTAPDPFGDLFSPGLLKSVNHGAADNSYFAQGNVAQPDNVHSTANGGDSTAGIADHRVFRFNSTSVASDTASPSMSSLSHGQTSNSSCGTSPEPIHDSPATKLKTMEGVNSIAKQTPQYSFSQLPSTTAELNFANLDAFNVPQIDSFDPVLFGDYRDTNENIVGGGDFTGGFFDDGFGSQPFDLGSPSTLFGILSPSTTGQKASAAPTPSYNLLADVDKARDGGDDDYGLPSAQAGSTEPAKGNLISCTKIWDQLQSNPDFQDGKFDLDGLCSELRTKARCSESGLLVDANHVDQAFKKLVAKPVDPSRQGQLMFEQESWDNVLKKLKEGKQPSQ